MSVVEKTTKAQMIREAILLCADPDGTIRSEAVFEAAKNPNNILHGEFVWDGTDAIRQLGLIRASQLIRVHRVEVVVDSIKLISPKFVSKPGSSEAGSYVAIENLAQDSKERKIGALIDEVTRIEALLKRAIAMATVLNVVPELMSLLDPLTEIKNNLKG